METLTLAPTEETVYDDSGTAIAIVYHPVLAVYSLSLSLHRERLRKWMAGQDLELGGGI